MTPPSEASANPASSRLGLSVFSLVLVWTLVIGGLGIWHCRRIEQGFLDNAHTAAGYSLDKDMNYRRWAAEHGGVYVPVSERTPPNPYLSHLPERDLVTPSGRRLTLLNPAYMTRQVHESTKHFGNLPGHITSLKLMRPENAADPWEQEALHAFAAGEREWGALTDLHGKRYFRLMRPFYVEESCLGCHGDMGYRLGEVRGGISVAIPWEPYRSSLVSTWSSLAYAYGGIWLTGMLFIALHHRRIAVHLRKRRRFEEKLARSRGHFQAIFDRVSDAILLHDADSGEILGFNARAEKLLGLRKDNVPYPRFADLGVEPASAGDADITAWIDRARRDGTLTFEWRMRHRGGRLFPVEATMSLTDLLDRQTLLTTIRDISERKEAEAELQRKNAEIEQLVYAVSHDLKSPLVTVTTFLAYLRKDLTAGNGPRVEKDIEFMRLAAAKMDRLIRELLEFSRTGMSGGESTTATFQELAEEAVAVVAGRIRENGVQVHIGSGDCNLKGNREELARVWQNLLENAVKYMGGQREPRVEIGVEAGRDQPVFYVRDNGAGIEARFHEKIFGLFENFDADSEGTGLGLALVKRLVELNGGRIWVESAGIGRGSCFRFTLPAAVAGDPLPDKTF